MSIFAVGDIHGRLDRLNGILAKLPLAERDTLVFVGDYVDRGPDSKGVVDRLIALQEEMGDRCVCLLGNHDDMFLDYWRQTRGKWRVPDSLTLQLLGVPSYGDGFWISVGGDKTLGSYDGEIPERHVEWLAGLPLTYETDDFVFVHAGPHPRGGTPRGQMLWGAPAFWSDVDPLTGRPLKGGRRTFPRIVVVGHTHFTEPRVTPDVIGIDTGCGHGGPWTAVQLPEMIFYSEPESGFAI